MPEQVVSDIRSLLLEEESFGTEQIARLRESLADSPDAYQDLRDAVQILAERAEEASGAAASPLRLRLGVAQHFLGHNSEAIESLKAAAPSDGLAAYYLGRAHLGRGDYDEAAQYFADAARSGYDRVDASLAQAGALRAAGQLDQARKLIDGVRDQAGESAEYLYQLGCCLIDQWEADEGIGLLERSIEKDPNHAGALFALAYQNDLHGDDETALDLYERAVSATPTHVGALVNLGVLYEDRQQYDDAARCYRRVLRVFPNQPRARLFFKDADAGHTMYYDEDAERYMSRMSQVLGIPVTDFELSVRSRNCLKKMQIRTLGDLTSKTEQDLLSSKNFGETSLEEIKEMLSSKGLQLGQSLQDDGPQVLRREAEDLSPQERAVLNKPVSDLNLSVRARKCMTKLGINLVSDLVRRTGDELLESKNFGVTSLNEVRSKLSELGLKLRGD